MKIEEIKLSELKPYLKNAKKHEAKQIKQVAESIKKFGFQQNLVVDKNNEIVIGHCRYEAAKLLGMETVPCQRVEGLNAEEIKALRLADNKLNESLWDMDLAIEELKGLDKENFKFTGFNEKEINLDIDLDDIGGNENREVNSKTQKVTCPKCGNQFEI